MSTPGTPSTFNQENGHVGEANGLLSLTMSFVEQFANSLVRQFPDLQSRGKPLDVKDIVSAIIVDRQELDGGEKLLAKTKSVRQTPAKKPTKAKPKAIGADMSHAIEVRVGTTFIKGMFYPADPTKCAWVKKSKANGKRQCIKDPANGPYCTDCAVKRTAEKCVETLLELVSAATGQQDIEPAKAWQYALDNNDDGSSTMPPGQFEGSLPGEPTENERTVEPYPEADGPIFRDPQTGLVVYPEYITDEDGNIYPNYTTDEEGNEEVIMYALGIDKERRGIILPIPDDFKDLEGSGAKQKDELARRYEQQGGLRASAIDAYGKLIAGIEPTPASANGSGADNVEVPGAHNLPDNELRIPKSK